MGQVGRVGWFHMEWPKKAKQVPLKTYSLEIRINSVNQVLKNKEKVKQTCNLTMLTRIKDRKILCVYIHVYRIAKIEDLVCIILYDTLIIEDIFQVSLTQNWREVHMFYLAREVGKFGHVLSEKKVTL